MSEFEQEVSRPRRRFSEEFKRDAVRLVVEEGYTLQGGRDGSRRERPELAGLACEVCTATYSVWRERQGGGASRRGQAASRSSLSGPNWSVRS